MSSFFWSMFYSGAEGHGQDLEQLIQADNLAEILKSDKFLNDIHQGNNSLLSYLSKHETIMRLIQYAYDPRDEFKDLGAAANEVFIADISSLLDSVAANTASLEALFGALQPWSVQAGRYLTLEECGIGAGADDRAEIEGLSSGEFSAAAMAAGYVRGQQRRVPLHVAENFCRLVIMLVRSPIRLKRIQSYLLANCEILSLFIEVISSAPSTEAIHYLLVGKDRSVESIQLQTDIIVRSKMISRMFALFKRNAAFDSLMHASFIVCSLLASGCTAPVRNMILDLSPDLLVATLTSNSHPGTVRTLLQMVVAAFREAVRFGILSETFGESRFYADAVHNMLAAMTPGMTQILAVPNAQAVSGDASRFLLKVHVISAVAELLRLSDTSKDAIREKEERTLANSFQPDASVDFLEAYYTKRAEAAGALPAGQVPAQLPALENVDTLFPFVVGLSYMFQDVYVHLGGCTSYRFGSAVAQACIEANKQIVANPNAAKKAITIQHTLGPDGEVIYGSSAYIAAQLISSGVPRHCIQEMLLNPDQSVVHHACTVIATQLLEYVYFNPSVSLALFDRDFFAAARTALLIEEGLSQQAASAAGPDQLAKVQPKAEARLSQQALRSSMDAHLASILSQLGRAAFGGPAGEMAMQPFTRLREILEGNADARFVGHVLHMRDGGN